MNEEKILRAIRDKLKVIYIYNSGMVGFKYEFGSMAVEVGQNVYDTCRNILRTAIIKLVQDSGSFTEAKIYMGPQAFPGVQWMYDVLVKGVNEDNA